MNEIMVTGFLAKDAEWFSFGQGDQGLRASVAVNFAGDGKGEKSSEFFNFALFGKYAQFKAPQLAKGALVIVKGEPNARDYVAKDGSRRKQWEIKNAKVELLVKNQSAPSANYSPQTAYAPQNHAQTAAYAPQQPAQYAQAMPVAPSAPAEFADGENLPF